MDTMENITEKIIIDTPSDIQKQDFEHPSAYIRHFKEVIQLVITNQTSLFTEIEQDLLTSFLDLPIPEQCLLTRMLLRQGIWLRADRLSAAFPAAVVDASILHELENTSSEEEKNPIDKGREYLLKRCIVSLQTHPKTYLACLDSKAHWTEGWEAMNACLTVDEIKDVYHKLTRKKAKGTRASILNELFVHMTTSKDLFGRPLPLVTAIHTVLSTRSNSSMKDTTLQPTHLLLHLSPQILNVFRRAQRLIQVPSMLSMYGHGRAASVQRPLPFNAAMLTIFGKVRFHNYAIHVTKPLFSGRQKFLKWEAAHELKWAFREAMNVSANVALWIENQGTTVDTTPVCVKLSPLHRCEIETVIKSILECSETFGYNKQMKSSCDLPAVILYVLNSAGVLCSPGKAISAVDVVTRLPFAFCMCVLLIWDAYCLSSSESASDYMASVDAGALLVSLCSEVVDILEVEARRVLKTITNNAFDRFSEDRTTFWWSDNQLINIIGMRNESDLGRYNICFSFVLAISTLRSILNKQFLVHRRGKWVERLCIDLDHIGCRHEALNACIKGLADPIVEGGHRITLERKRESLSVKLKAPTASTDTTFNKKRKRHNVAEVDDKDCDTYAEKSIKKKAKHISCRKRTSSGSADKEPNETVPQPELNSECTSATILLSEILNCLYDNALACRKEPLEKPQQYPLKQFSKEDSDNEDDVIILTTEEYKAAKKANLTKKRPKKHLSISPNLEVTWSCHVCTLINPSSREKCDACGTKYPMVTVKRDEDLSVPRTSSSSQHDTTRCTKTNSLFSVTDYDICEASSEHLPVLTVLWGDIIVPPVGWVPDVLELTGRRLGNKRKGKNLLLGPDGDAISVETLVLELLGMQADERDEDETLLSGGIARSNNSGMEPLMYTGGCWKGWHCEGAPLRSLFGLLMWDIIFLDSVPNVFYTPYQDQPLDLLYGSHFYHNREAEINAKFRWLETAAIKDILIFLSNTYRDNYKCRCVSVSWVHPLHILQAIALAMGGVGLVALCKLMISNFRHFQGGAPDLLLLRGYRKVENGEGASYEYVSMSKWLGSEWSRLGRPKIDGGSYRWGRGKREFPEEEWNNLADISIPSTLNDNYGESQIESIEYENNNARDEDEAIPTDADTYETFGEGEDVDSRATESMNKNVRKNFVYYGPDLGDPKTDIPSSGSVNSEMQFDWIDDWVFQCMFVEVKGPTDHLADRQAVWIHALDRNQTASQCRSLVCQIREGRNGQDSGHVESLVVDHSP